MINKVTLLGNLGKDPEIRTFENGSKVARFSLATNKNFKDKAGEWQTQTEWHNIVVWGYAAEHAEKFLKKGGLAYVEGEINYREYEADGQKKYITEIKGDVLKSLEKRETLEPHTQPEPAGAEAGLPF